MCHTFQGKYEHDIRQVTGKTPRFQDNFMDLKDFSILEDSHVRVEFANPKGLFYAGEDLAANVIVSLRKAMRCQKMTLQYVGYNRVFWDRTDGQGNSYSVDRNGEEYFYNPMVLIAPRSPFEDVIIPQGELNYPFQFSLPANLPPTINTPYGRISYGIIAKILGVVANVQRSTNARYKTHRIKKRNLMSEISFKVSRTTLTPRIQFYKIDDYKISF